MNELSGYAACGQGDGSNDAQFVAQNVSSVLKTPQNNTTWGTSRVELPNSVAPGESVTFSFNVTAPVTAGLYNFQWKMVQESVGWFGALSTNFPPRLAGD